MLETAILLALAERDNPADAKGDATAKARWKEMIENISFIDGLIGECGLEFEKIGRNILAWRIQNLARVRSDLGLKAPFPKDAPPLETALMQAGAQGAMGLHARLVRLGLHYLT